MHNVHKKSSVPQLWLCHGSISRHLHVMCTLSMWIWTFFTVEYRAHMSWARAKYTTSRCVIVPFHASAISLFHSVSLSICLSSPLRPSSLTGYLSWAWPCWLWGYDLTLQSLSTPHCCISLRHWRGTHTFTHYTPQRHAVQFTLKRSMLLRLRYMAHQSWMDNHACELRDIG